MSVKFRNLIRIAAYIFLCIFIFMLSLSVAGFYISISPHRVPVQQTPANFNMPFEKIAFKTGDGIPLAAWWIHKNNEKTLARQAVLLLHGYHSSKRDLLSVASFLYPAFDVMIPDFSAHGESGGRFTTIGALETRDARAAAAFLRNKGYRRIGIFGFSMGGAVAIQTCGEKGVYAIVTDSAYANLDDMIESRYSFLIVSPLKLFASFTTRILSRIVFGIWPSDISPAEDLHTCSVPVFAMHAAHDPLVPVSQAHKIRNALGGRKNSEVLIFNAHGHGTLHAIFGKQYENKVLRFFRRYL